jgi:hypothetical protein
MLTNFFNIKSPVTQFLVFLFLFFIIGQSDLLITAETQDLWISYMRDAVLYFVIAVILGLALFYIPKNKKINPSNFLISTIIIFVLIHPTSPFISKVLAILILPVRALLFKYKQIQIFNPAVFSLFTVYWIFDIFFLITNQENTYIISWWGADLTFQFLEKIPILMYSVATGLLISFIYFSKKFKKHLHPIIFVTTYLLLSGGYFAITESIFPQEILLTSFKALLFAGFVMLSEPKTSPVKINHQIFLGFFSGFLLFLITDFGLKIPGDPLINILMIANLISFVLKVIDKQKDIKTQTVSTPNVKIINTSNQKISR